MKKTKLRLLLFLLFWGGLIIFPQKAKAAEKASEIITVNISVKYGQTEARTILNMINEARTNSEHTWYWNMNDTAKIYCGVLPELKYDYDLERVAMKRAAEIALSYAHERPMGGSAWDIYRQENISYYYAGENIAAGQTTAREVNLAWREDDQPYAGQGHRRNMLSSQFNCVGIGHAYYNGTHYWVEEFGYRPDINTTEVSANDSTETVSVSVNKTKIREVNVRFDQESYSLRIGENTTPEIKETSIDVVNYWSWSYGSGLAPVLDIPVISVADSSIADYNNNQLSGLKEGTTNLTATLYGITASGSSTVSVHDCKNHWDNGSVTKKPTCTAPGEKTFTCSMCKSTKTESVSATGHNYASVWTTDIAATCENTGTESRHCKNENCTATTEQRSIAALGHIWEDNKDETATCIRNGCNAKHTHVWDSGTRTTEPTCTTDGEQIYHCNYEKNGVCTATKTEAIKKLGHRYVLTKRDAPTCESDGILHGKCSRCSKIITKRDTKNPALGHSWTDNGDGTATCSREGCGTNHTHELDSGTISVAPTCTTNGEKEYCCTYTNCSYKKTEPLTATGHKNKETRNGKKPTCKEDGYTGDVYCKDCGILLSSGKVTKKFEHDWNSGTVTKVATCTEEGTMTYTCESCGDTETIKIPMTLHNYIIKQQKDATCTENGYLISVCQTCNDEKKEEIPATGHVNRTLNEKKATCKEEGYTGDVYCQVCDKLLEEGQVIPKADHVWNKGEITTQPTASRNGIRTYTCQKCKATKTETINVTGLKVGATIKDTKSNGYYKVTDKKGLVSFVKPINTKKSSVTIPDTINYQGITCRVTAIGNNAFKGNKYLAKLKIGKYVTTIGSSSFYGCVKLSGVTIGNNTVKIGNYAFAKCTAFSKLTIPSKVTTIGKQAFYGCKKLKSITIKTNKLTTKTVGSNCFKEVYAKPTIAVPNAKYSYYKKLLYARGVSSKAVFKKF